MRPTHIEASPKQEKKQETIFLSKIKNLKDIKYRTRRLLRNLEAFINLNSQPMKNYFLSFCFLLVCGFINAQVNWQCGMSASPPQTTSPGNGFSPSGSCTGNNPYQYSSIYIPLDQANQPTITLKVNMIFWGNSNYANGGNFNATNTTDMSYLTDLENEVNRRVSNWVDPGSTSCYGNSNPTYLKDTKIKFDFKRYFITDGYLWDINNATLHPYHCPSWWNQTYKDVIKQRLEENNVREGFNVFFHQEGTAYQQMLVDQTASHFEGVASTVQCSQSPSLDFDKNISISMQNVYLMLNFLQSSSEYTWTYSESINSNGRILLHELLHAFGLGHTSPASCSQNIMRDTIINEGNYLKPSQMGVVLKTIHDKNIRKYVCCPTPNLAPRIITDEQSWSFNSNIYSDIIVESGGELRICGTIYMPVNGVIEVRRGGKLILDGGTISFNRAAFEDCSDKFWGGIKVEGNTSSHAGVDVNNLQPYDPGVVDLRGGILEYANSAVENAKRGEEWNSDYWGGIVLADGTTFTNCRRSAGLFPVNGSISVFRNCTFKSPDAVAYTGITCWDMNPLVVDSCSFDNLGKEGIRLVDSEAFIFNGCTFENMIHGVYATASSPSTGPVFIGSTNSTDARNKFSKLTTGVSAIGFSDINIQNNDFTNMTWGTSIRGLSGGSSLGNYFDNNVINEDFFRTSSFRFEAECNEHNLANNGYRMLGNNSGFKFNSNEFVSTVHDLYIDNAKLELGSISLLQGSSQAAFDNVFSNTVGTDVFSRFEETEQFWYYYPEGEDPANSNLVPDCAINGTNNTGCMIVSNFRITDAPYLGTNPSCDQSTLFPEPCPDKDCLEDHWTLIQLEKSRIDSGATNYLLNELTQNPVSNQVVLQLQETSPYLSDEVLSAVLNSTLSATEKADILDANSPLSPTILYDSESKVAPNRYTILEQSFQSGSISPKQMLLGAINELETTFYSSQIDLLKSAINQKNWTAAYDLALITNNDYANMLAFHTGIAAKQYEQAGMYMVQHTNSDWSQAAAIHLDNRKFDNYVLATADSLFLEHIATGDNDHKPFAQALLNELAGRSFLPEPINSNALVIDHTANQAEKTQRTKVSQDSSLPVVSVFPNPATDQLTINTASGGDKVIQLSDISGRITMDQQYSGHQTVLNTGHLNPGLYLLSVTDVLSGATTQLKVILK